MKVKFFNPTRELKTRKKEIDKAIKEIYTSGNFASGKNVIEFEEKFADYCGVKYCCATSNGTSALEIAVRFFKEGVSCSKNAWTSPNTFSASSEAIVTNGLFPRFIDTDNTANLSIKTLMELNVSSKDLILPISLYSNPFNILALREKYPNNFIILDQCQAVGCLIKEKPIDKYADASCYSFYPTKVLGGIGEGGAIVTNNEELYKFAKCISFHGQSTKYFHSKIGTNARMTELVAASLSIKLKYLEETIKERVGISEIYSKSLYSFPHLEFINVREMDRCPYYVFPIYVIDPLYMKDPLYNENSNKRLSKHLSKNNIETAFHYPLSLHLQKAYEMYAGDDLRTAERQFRTQISLPLFYGIKEEEVDYIIEKVEEFLTEYI